MTKFKPWVRLPTGWIREGRLRSFRWTKGEGAAHAAALLVLAPLAHHSNEETGDTRVTYDMLEKATGLSRSKISEGLKVLQAQEIITPSKTARSMYALTGYSREGGWSKFPAKGLYQGGKMAAFDDFNLRNLHELNALKLFYLFIERRDNLTNLAKISYDKISDQTGIERARIRSALSLLAVNGLVHVERVQSDTYVFGIANAYRIADLDPFRHMGNVGRAFDQGIPTEYA